MKKILTLALTLCCTLQLQLVSAQSAELQQLALNIEKLSQLKQVLANMKKGYDIINQGYGTIKNISEGNFNLHQTFLDGLMIVSPGLRKYSRVADIINYQGQLIKEYKSAFSRFKNSGQFTPNEISYMSGVYGNLFDRSLQQIDELTMILTSGKLRMSDDERLEGINRIYEDMQGKIAFLRNFNNHTAQVENARATLQKQNQVLKKMQGL